MEEFEELRAGIDVGSTTVKLVVTDTKAEKILYSYYQRHNSMQEETVYEILKNTKNKFKNNKVKVAVCGSGGKPIAERIGTNYVQEVVANSVAVCKLYPNAKTAIELRWSRCKGNFLLL